MCIHSHENAKWLLDYRLKLHGKDKGLTVFRNDIKEYAHHDGANSFQTKLLQRVLDEYLHPEKVRAAAQTYIDKTSQKIDESNAWQAQLNRVSVPA